MANSNFTANDQVLLTILTSMESDGTIDDNMKVTLERLRKKQKQSDKPDNSNESTEKTNETEDDFSLEYVYNNLVYPDNLAEEDKFTYAVSKLLQLLVRLNAKNMFKWLDNIAEGKEDITINKETHIIVEKLRAFYQSIIDGAFIGKGIKKHYMDLMEELAKDMSQHDLDKWVNNLSLEENKWLVSQPFNILTSLLKEYKHSDHEIFLCAIGDMLYIRTHFNILDFFKNFRNQIYNFKNVYSCFSALNTAYTEVVPHVIELPTTDWKEKLVFNTSEVDIDVYTIDIDDII